MHVTADGVVLSAGWSGAYGKRVVVDHGNGLRDVLCPSFPVAGHSGPGSAPRGRDRVIGRHWACHFTARTFQVGVKGTPCESI